MKLAWAVCLVVLLTWHDVTRADNVVLNTTSAATLCAPPAGCAFSNPAIWGSLNAPSTFDSVTIQYALPTPILIICSSPYALTNLEVSGPVTLQVTATQAGTWTLQVTNLQVTYEGTLLIQSFGSVQSTGIVEVTLSSGIILMDNGKYSHDGNPANQNSFLLDAQSSLLAMNYSFVSLSSSSLPQLYGTVSYAAGVTLGGSASYYTNNIVFPNIPSAATLVFNGISATFLNGLICNNLVVLQASAFVNTTAQIQNLTISQGSNVSVVTATGTLGILTGQGNLSILTSSLTMYGSGAQVPYITLGGSVNITASNAEFGQLYFIPGFYNESANVNFTLSGSMKFSGGSAIQGSIFANNAQLTLGGALSLSGQIIASASDVAINGTLKSNNITLLPSGDNTTSTLLVNGNLTAPFIFLEEGCSLSCSNGNLTSSYVTATISNSGSLTISPSFPLRLQGSYIQQPNSSVIVYLDPSVSSQPALQVSGYVELAGDLFYELSTNSSHKQVTFQIISSSGEINGTFANGPTNVTSNFVTDLQLTYSTHEIILVAFKNIPHKPLLAWWMIILIVIGSLAICLVMSHFTILACRHRHHHQYEEFE